MSAAPKNLIFVGPPGAGKGTQAAAVAKQYGIAHISTGDLFRSNLTEKTPVGLLAKGYMDKGVLVPDEVVCDMVKGRLDEADTAAGFLLDGFPRTKPQAEVLDEMLADLGRELSAVVSFEVPDSKLMERLTGRLTCKACGAIFHRTLNPPAKAGTCDSCGKDELYQRADDQEEKVSARIAEHHEKTSPLLAYYGARSLVAKIDGTQPIDLVREALEGLLDDQ